MNADTARTDSARLAVASPPWWRFGMVWFVLSGPALVVVAGFTTMAIAFIGADTEMHEPTAVGRVLDPDRGREPARGRRVLDRRRCDVEAAGSDAALRNAP